MIDINTFELIKDDRTFSEVYRTLIFGMAEKDSDIVLGEADLGRAMIGNDYTELKKKNPKQMYDVGIAEANLVGIASGLAVVGKTPIVHTFAAFITRRTYDTIFVSCAYAKLNVNLVGSDPGVISTYNGGTHMTFEDIGMIRSVPNTIIFEPTDNVMLKNLFPKLVKTDVVTYTRIARRTAPDKIYHEDTVFEIGKAITLTDGDDATIITFGSEVCEALKAAKALAEEGIKVRVIDAVTVAPLDVDCVIKAAKETGAVVTVENHSIKTGLFAEVSGVIARNCPCPMQALGIEDEFGEVGNYAELMERFRLTDKHIVDAVKNCIEMKKR